MEMAVGSAIVDGVSAAIAWVDNAVVDALAATETGSRRVFSGRANLEGRSHGSVRFIKPADAADTAPFKEVGVIEFISALAGPLLISPKSIAGATLAGSRLSIVCGAKHVFVFDKPGVALQAAAALATEAGVAVAGADAAAVAAGEPEIFSAVALCNSERLERELADGACARDGAG